VDACERLAGKVLRRENYQVSGAASEIVREGYDIASSFLAFGEASTNTASPAAAPCPKLRLSTVPALNRAGLCGILP
jgi:hypothetical protein